VPRRRRGARLRNENEQRERATRTSNENEQRERATRTSNENEQLSRPKHQVEGTKARIYHAGDTAYFEGFKEIGARFAGIDAALLPIGAYDPPWFMERQHMNPEQAVQAFLDLGARKLVAMHWGTFKLTDEPLDEPPRRLRQEWARRGLPEAALHIPAIGETLQLSQG
jgi:L-ascorbate metabolism protein UlaG (beta-lactamase superfamily)